jgi:hypothetical protein
MADTTQELKTLNKTVTEAVTILKLYVGNSAQVKAMNEKEKEVLDKWLKVTDMADDNEKKQRAFTERQRDEQGRFLKKQDQQSKKFMGIAESIKGIFGSITQGIKVGVSNLVNNVVSHMSNFFQAIKSQFLSLFGEESEWFQLLSSIKDSIKGFIGSIISFIWQRTPNWAKKMIKYLQSMYLLQVKEFKQDLLDVGYKKGKGVSLKGMVTALIALIGGSIGAFLGRYFGFISKLPIFNKIGKLFKSLEAVPFLGRLLKAFKFGFKVFGYPLQLLLGVMDFIKAFRETEGTLWEKIKSGLWAAFEGFIDAPIRLITWATEKLLGMFGIKFDGDAAADKLMSFFKSAFDFILFGWEELFKSIKIGYDWIEPKLKEWTDLLLDALNPTINWIIDMWNNIIEMAQSLLPDFMAKKLEGLKGEHRGISETGQKAREEANRIEVEKAKVQAKVQEQQKEMAKQGSINQKQVEQNTYLSKAVQFLSGNRSGGGQGDVQQIPDETDNYLVGFAGHNGAME